MRFVRHIIRRLPLACFLLLAVCVQAPAPLSAETFTSNCVGISDGDTIQIAPSDADQNPPQRIWDPA